MAVRRLRRSNGSLPNGTPRDELGRGRLDGLLGYWLRRAQVRVFQDFATAMAKDGLTPGQLGVILLVEANPGISQSALAAALGIDRSTAVALIDRLQRRGLVKRSQRAGDRRANALEIPRAGRPAFARILARLSAHEARIAAALDPADRETLLGFLRRVATGAAGPVPSKTKGRHADR